MWQLRLTHGQDGMWADHAAQSLVISANELVSFLQGGVGAVMSFLRTTEKRNESFMLNHLLSIITENIAPIS